jgi:hypothetical protein
VGWDQILNSLFTASPLAGVLGYVGYKLWGKLAEKDKVIAEKDQEISDLNDRRIRDLKRIANVPLDD